MHKTAFRHNLLFRNIKYLIESKEMNPEEEMKRKKSSGSGLFCRIV